ncbi:hypothetical protein [Lacrimispora xylanisolvens]|uniref:hypothetical protein n=1 Tax=Lacrimispora xylanisolvens TaxID=384636 RepID=UPI002402D2E3
MTGRGMTGKKDCITIKEKLGIYGSSKVDHFIAGVTMRASQTKKKMRISLRKPMMESNLKIRHPLPIT